MSSELPGARFSNSLRPQAAKYLVGEGMARLYPRLLKSLFYWRFNELKKTVKVLDVESDLDQVGNL